MNFDLASLTPEQRLWGKALCQMILDAIEGPMPEQSGTKRTNDDDGSVERESRAISRSQITDMDDAFCFVCDAVGFEPESVRDSYLAGNMTREGIYYVMDKLSSR